MRRFVVSSLVALAVSLGAFTQVSDEQMLQKADEARFLQFDSFVLTMKITAERPDKAGGVTKSEALLKLLNKRFSEGYRVRVEFLEPDSMKDTVYLIVGDDIFFWQPGLVRPIKISGQQKLFGDAGIAEAAGIAFTKYTIKGKEETKLDNKESLKLNLAAKSPSTAYQVVTLWLDKKELKPLQAVLHAITEEPLRKVVYQKYERFQGDEYIAEELVEDLLIKDHRTSFKITNIEVKELPDDLFDPEKLGK